MKRKHDNGFVRGGDYWFPNDLFFFLQIFLFCLPTVSRATAINNIIMVIYRESEKDKRTEATPNNI